MTFESSEDNACWKQKIASTKEKKVILKFRIKLDLLVLAVFVEDYLIPSPQPVCASLQDLQLFEIR